MEWFKVAVFLLISLELTWAVSEVTYVCFTKGHNAVRLVCPKERRIRVVEARYGRSRWGACVLAAGVGVEAQACTQQTMEYTPCCGQSTCLMPAKAVYMPACGYQSHFLRIIHDCVKDKPVVCGPSLMGVDNSAEKDKNAVKGSNKVNDSFDVVGERDVVEITPIDIPPTRNMSLFAVNMTKTTDNPKGTDQRNDFHLVRLKLKNRKHPEKYTIMGFDAVIVWSFLGVGLFIVIILSLILILLCRQSPRKKSPKKVSEEGDLKTAKSHFGDQLYFDDYKASHRKCDNYINAKRETLCREKGNVNPGYYPDTTGKKTRQDGGRSKSSPATSVRSTCSGISLDDNEEIRRPQPSIRSNKTGSCGGCKLNIDSYVPQNMNNVCVDKSHKPKLKPKPVFH